MKRNILRLDEILKEKNIKQIDLANRLNLSKQTVNYWVKNKNLPSINTLDQIANELKINIKDLLK
jgi:putative transcriptional regulator